MTTKKLLTMLIGLTLIPVALLSLLYLFFAKGTERDLDAALTQENIVPVVIIGAGPAGLSAATWTARAKLTTIVYAGREPGGQLNQAKNIENWPGKQKMAGGDIIKDLEDQAQHFGAHIINAVVKDIDLSTWPFKVTSEDGTIIHALSVIIATGGVTKILDVPGAQKYMGKGIGICTICDAPFNKDQEVVVIGSDDPAGERALQLAAYAKKVTMISNSSHLLACATVQDYLKNTKNIDFIFSADILEILGDGTNATGLRLRNKKTNDITDLKAKTIFFSIGYTPTSELIKKYIKTDSDGYVKVKGRTQHTSVPGVFAAGNVEDKIYGKAGIAAGDGIRAALDAISFLESIGLNPSIAQEKKQIFYVPTKQQQYPITLVENERELQKIFATSKVPVVVDFFATYCASCRYVLPVIEVLAGEYSKELHFVKFDISNSPESAHQMGVTRIPTVIVYDKGKEITRCTSFENHVDLINCIAAIVPVDITS